MSARDTFHYAFRRALEKDGWTITDVPLRDSVGKTDLLIDLGAERLVAAQRDNERIAVEIKSFIGSSAVQDLKEALGQYQLYQIALERSKADSDRALYLAVRAETFEAVFEEPLGKAVLDKHSVKMIVVDDIGEAIEQWIT